MYSVSHNCPLVVSFENFFAFLGFRSAKVTIFVLMYKCKCPLFVFIH